MQLDNMIWFKQYEQIIAESKQIDDQIKDLDDNNIAVSLKRNQDFFQNFGANYKKNKWMVEYEKEHDELQKNQKNELAKKTSIMELIEIINNCISNPTEDMLNKLNINNYPQYESFLSNLNLYIQINCVKDNYVYWNIALDNLMKLYGIEWSKLLTGDGYQFHLELCQCLYQCYQNYQVIGGDSFEEMKREILKRITKYYLWIKQYMDRCRDTENEYTRMKVLNDELVLTLNAIVQS